MPVSGFKSQLQSLTISSRIPAPNHQFSPQTSGSYPCYFTPNSAPKTSLFHPKYQPQILTIFPQTLVPNPPSAHWPSLNKKTMPLTLHIVSSGVHYLMLSQTCTFLPSEPLRKTSTASPQKRGIVHLVMGGSPAQMTTEALTPLITYTGSFLH